MHTAHTLARDQFHVEIDGQPAHREDLIADHPFVRLGIVVDRPLGALGASLFLQLGITAYFDASGKNRRAPPHYAEVYVFHVGGRHGDHSILNIWPARREIDVADRGPDMLAAINGAGVTHLLLPDTAFSRARHYFKEPNIARDRIAACLLYDPGGRTAQGDVTLWTQDAGVIADCDGMIDTAAFLAMVRKDVRPADDAAEREDQERWLASLEARLPEVGDADRQAARARRDGLICAGRLTETYRRIGIGDALHRLGD